ncbi:hypothetical protein EC957_011227 [Mortierella hygrophila]|uniref:Uncharacterized protein n=1 Tax=Mortierella hygrophila TaxID=979708 RepID=A0A9P6F8V9_9FUNG|nr:hypothetical protein EC957_011227 [Mortierella hygrophila]
MEPNPGGSKAVGVQRWVKRVVVGVPVTVQEAIARRAKRVGIDGEQQRDIASTNANSSLLVSNENGTDSQVSSNRVRRILFKSCLLSSSIFHRLIKECHSLDEIVLGGRSFTLLPDTWIVLSAQCPGLRIIRIQECNNLEPLPGVSTFIGMFLRLEELELNTVMFEKDPDDLHDGLDAVLKEHEVKVGVRHSLKALCLLGFLRRPIYALADLLALPSTLSNIESLTVGGIDVPNYTGETESASELLSTSALARYAFMDCSRWGLFSRLVVLDISLVDVPDKEMLRRLFDCFRDPNCWLRKLSVNVCHIQDLMENSVCRAFRLQHNNPEQHEIKYRRKEWRDMALRYCGLCPVETPGMDLFEAR